ncbi:MAG: hypothetical protein Q9190_001841 [Brigantiaea leucoxantha]
MSSPAPVKVGILMLSEGVQILDVTPVDILGMLQPAWLQFTGLPEDVVAQGPNLEFYFINESGKGPQQMTAGFKVEVTVYATSYIPALYSGIFDGKEATAPRNFIPTLKKEEPQVKWVEKRWARDGKVWSSGAVTNGQDMMAAFVREMYPREIVEVTLGMSDVVARGQEYEGGSAAS